MAEWVFKNYERVTKQTVVRSYLRSVLHSMGVIDFDGERVVLTAAGERLKTRTADAVFALLKENILGTEEIMTALAAGLQDISTVLKHLIKALGVSWETEHQVQYRFDWLRAVVWSSIGTAGGWLARVPSWPHRVRPYRTLLCRSSAPHCLRRHRLRRRRPRCRRRRRRRRLRLRLRRL